MHACIPSSIYTRTYFRSEADEQVLTGRSLHPDRLSRCRPASIIPIILLIVCYPDRTHQNATATSCSCFIILLLHR